MENNQIHVLRANSRIPRRPESRNRPASRNAFNLRSPDRNAPTAREGATRINRNSPKMTEKPSGQSVFSDSQSDWWSQLSSAITICCIPGLLERFNIKGANVQQAWREKITLCVIIGLIMLLVAYFTLGLKSTLCWDSGETNPFFNPGTSVIPWRSTSLVRGQEYNFTTMQQFLSQQNPAVNLTADWYGVDIARLFKPNSDACDSFVVDPKKICTIPNKLPGSPSLSTNECIGYKSLQSIPSVNRLTFDWVDVSSNFQPPHTLVIFNGAVLNLTDFFRIEKDRDYRNIPALDKLIPGNDVTLGMSSSSDKAQFMYCLASRYTVGIIGVESAGCAVYNSLMIIALLTILGIILARFIMALVFHWMIAPSISRSISTRLGRNDIGYLNPTVRNLYLTQRNEQNNNGPLINQTWARSLALPTDLFTILLVTCYSENKQGIKGTLDSLAATDYPDDRKLLFVICDGLIQGAGNTETTPDIVISLIEQDDTLPIDTKSYLAIADGVKQHNMAKVYAGRYMYQQRPVPIIVVVKCGNEDERRAVPQDKPGNRGKRDSQLLLFNFLSRVTYNDRMTALDYDLFWKIQKITGGVTPDFYQLLLMIDADTIVQPDSLRYMVQTMVNDPGVIGLCGETRVENKMESWVTMIQVYEYFTNHNLGKSFESVFGGVTCLPGCFCMYRIKSPAGSHCIPFLVSPDIVEAYSENIVDTLHKKNLLLLGEDRFLSTLMLGTFPNRKMVFVPQAICHTTVPHTYQMLQSQRRRWINSTIHNLLELVKLPNLCGTFCFSMQFVIAMELFGTVSLPAAVLLTFYLIIGAIFSANTPIIPLVILMITLFLPGVLVLMTTRKPQYVLWMFVYLLAIPIWNFMLPLYAFWNFDDFSWGDTRKVEGEDKTKDHSTKDGDYIIGSVVLKKWEEWELERRQLIYDDIRNPKPARINPPGVMRSVSDYDQLNVIKENRRQSKTVPSIPRMTNNANSNQKNEMPTVMKQKATKNRSNRLRVMNPTLSHNEPVPTQLSTSYTINTLPTTTNKDVPQRVHKLTMNDPGSSRLSTIESIPDSQSIRSSIERPTTAFLIANDDPLDMSSYGNETNTSGSRYISLYHPTPSEIHNQSSQYESMHSRKSELIHSKASTYESMSNTSRQSLKPSDPSIDESNYEDASSKLTGKAGDTINKYWSQLFLNQQKNSSMTQSKYDDHDNSMGSIQVPFSNEQLLQSSSKIVYGKDDVSYQSLSHSNHDQIPTGYQLNHGVGVPYTDMTQTRSRMLDDYKMVPHQVSPAKNYTQSNLNTEDVSIILNPELESHSFLEGQSSILDEFNSMESSMAIEPKEFSFDESMAIEPKGNRSMNASFEFGGRLGVGTRPQLETSRMNHQESIRVKRLNTSHSRNGLDTSDISRSQSILNTSDFDASLSHAILDKSNQDLSHAILDRSNQDLSHAILDRSNQDHSHAILDKSKHSHLHSYGINQSNHIISNKSNSKSYPNQPSQNNYHILQDLQIKPQNFEFNQSQQQQWIYERDSQPSSNTPTQHSIHLSPTKHLELSNISIPELPSLSHDTITRQSFQSIHSTTSNCQGPRPLPLHWNPIISSPPMKTSTTNKQFKKFASSMFRAEDTSVGNEPSTTLSRAFRDAFQRAVGRDEHSLVGPRDGVDTSLIDTSIRSKSKK